MTGADPIVELILGLLLTLLAGFFQADRSRRDRQLSEITRRLSETEQQTASLNATVKAAEQLKQTLIDELRKLKDDFHKIDSS